MIAYLRDCMLAGRIILSNICRLVRRHFPMSFETRLYHKKRMNADRRLLEQISRRHGYQELIR